MRRRILPSRIDSTYGGRRLALWILGLLALARYRAMVPLMFALFLVDQLGRRAIAFALPIERMGTPPASVINLALTVAMFSGFLLSLWRPSSAGRES